MSTPKRALVVIDVQNEYFTGQLPIDYPPVAESLTNIVAAMDLATRQGIPIVVVQHQAPDGAPVFAAGSPGFALHPEVACRPRRLDLIKRQASALVGTPLADWLHEQAIDTLTLVGYMTHNCLDATARHASQAGWQVELLADACGSLAYRNEWGSASGETLHRTFCLVMQTGFAAVATLAQWQVAVSAGRTLPRDSVFASHRRTHPQRP